jgi:hypothetical protein
VLAVGEHRDLAPEDVKDAKDDVLCPQSQPPAVLPTWKTFSMSLSAAPGTSEIQA